MSIWLDAIYPWISFILTIGFIILPVAIGQRIGTRIRGRFKELADAPLGSVVGVSLGLLAFMLAITFQIVTNRYDARKQVVLDEVTAIRSTYMRAALLPEPYRTEAQKPLSRANVGRIT